MLVLVLVPRARSGRRIGREVKATRCAAQAEPVGLFFLLKSVSKLQYTSVQTLQSRLTHHAAFAAGSVTR